jgi:hypothetical protein
MRDPNQNRFDPSYGEKHQSKKVSFPITDGFDNAIFNNPFIGHVSGMNQIGRNSSYGSVSSETPIDILQN